MGPRRLPGKRADSTKRHRNLRISGHAPLNSRRLFLCIIKLLF